MRTLVQKRADSQGIITLPALPGIGFEGKADLYAEMRGLAG